MEIKSLLNPTQRIAVLAGAGISLDAPSNLLDGWSFMFEALRRAAPAGIDANLKRSSADLKKNENWKKSWVLSILDLPDAPFRRPGEQLRFEVLMAELVQSGLDPTLRILDCLDACDKPNRNHYILARLIMLGHVVITTNFDRLIECAYGELAGPETPPLRVACMDEEFDPAFAADTARPTLWKIHGSLSVDGRDTRKSVQATMMSILTTKMTVRKAAFFGRVLTEYDLIVAGYSGWDDLDIIPTLANTPSARRLIWIDHRNESVPLVKNARQMTEEARAQWEVDSIGRDRIRFTEDPQGRTIRDPENILLVSTPTSKMMDAISEVYSGIPRFSPHAEPFHFGRDFPVETQAYFDKWRANLSHESSAPYAFVSGIFYNLANARRKFQQYIRKIDQEIESLQSRRAASPGEQLLHLIETFNKSDPNDLGGVEELHSKLLNLLPSLPSDLQGTGTRLLACLFWQLQGPDVGTETFKKAAAIDREAGNEKNEFHTLTTWRQFAGYSQWSDLIAEYDNETIRGRVSEAHLEEIRRQAEYVISLSGNPPFPAGETKRLHELAGRIGFFPRLWNQSLQAMTDVLDDDPQMLIVLNDRVRKLQRFTVDLGDVLGEAQSTLISGRIYMLDEQYQIAIEEFLRVLELDRIVNQPDLSSQAQMYLIYCIEQVGIDYVQTIKPHLQRSMWGREIP